MRFTGFLSPSASLAPHPYSYAYKLISAAEDPVIGTPGGFKAQTRRVAGFDLRVQGLRRVCALLYFPHISGFEGAQKNLCGQKSRAERRI